MFSKQVTDSKVYNWFQERLEIEALAEDVTSKYVPPHVNIFYCFGGMVLAFDPVCNWICHDVLL